ncbi:acyl transferase/acyl hydrolase/lysophospholipase [Syncephalis fuscata]|nr:acyl transferase/acyl hydrolase/lysophospholipase [Syncephalis fuscata]
MGAVRPRKRSRPSHASSITYAFIRIPLFLVILCVVLFELILYFLVRQIVNVWEYFFTWRGNKNRLRQKLQNTSDYNEWKEAAMELDRYLGLDAWKREPLDSSYDGRLIYKQGRLLRELREQGESAVPRLQDALLSGAMKSNIGGCENSRLYSRTYYGTKDVLERYVNQVTGSLEHIYESNTLSLEKKIRFFKKASRSYGRTALCLSGGASFAYYHFGVIQALLDRQLLPKVVTGTSGGALIAAIIGVRTDEELRPLITPQLADRINPFTDGWITVAKRFIQKRVMLEVTEMAEKLQWVTFGSTTFREAFERTGRILNVTVVPYGGHGPPKLLNHLTAPDVIIWSALLASSAVPGLLQPVVLMMKNEAGEAEPFIHSGHTWRDGSLRVDIPIEALNHYFNVRYTIVSQVNPHVILFFYDHRGSVGRPSSHLRGQGWRGGFVASSIEHGLKLDLKKWVRIVSDLELLPRIMDEDLAFLWLQRFHGNVTIIPKIAPGDYPRLLKDPTPESMVHYMNKGRRRTWPKLHMIENRMVIEKKIAICRRRLRRAQLNISASQIENRNNVINGNGADSGATQTIESNTSAERVRTLLSGVGSGSEVEIGQPSPDIDPNSVDIPADHLDISGRPTIFVDELGHSPPPISFAPHNDNDDDDDDDDAEIANGYESENESDKYGDSDESSESSDSDFLSENTYQAEDNNIYEV